MATTIKIGHASISENNTAYGQAGDSTGKEVCINPNFNILNMAPTVLLRPKSAILAETSALACEAGCANDNIGYSQSGRNTLYTYAMAVNYDLSKVSTKCNTDCSAFMSVCALAGGANITYGTNAPTTTTMRSRFKQSGDYTILTDSKHLTITDYLKRGDILVHEGSHTVMVLENGSQYRNESSEIEVPNDSNITPTRTIHTYSLNINLTNVKATSAVVRFSVSEYTNNIEKIIDKPTKWTYHLSIKALSTLKTVNYKFKTNELTLTNLVAGSSYFLTVIAKDGDDAIALCSVCRILTTPQNTSQEKQSIIFGSTLDIKPFELINKIYINDNNNFKQAVIYKNL